MGFPVDKRPPPPLSTLPAAGAGTGVGAPPQADGGAGGGGISSRGKVEKPKEKAGNDIDLVAALLRSRHAGHYMVWNVSEEGYDYSLFEDQVRGCCCGYSHRVRHGTRLYRTAQYNTVPCSTVRGRLWLFSLR
ncbi:unnamed protein product [Laminaria digitata]